MTASTKRLGKRKAKRVREGPQEPGWISRAVIEMIHNEQLREHGGSTGIRDEGLLESAPNRARNKHPYGETDLSQLAAAYAFGIAKNHAFVDGNKRTSFVTAALFLAVNGFELSAPEPEVVVVMNRLASGKLTESALADWIRNHIERLR